MNKEIYRSIMMLAAGILLVKKLQTIRIGYSMKLSIIFKKKIRPIYSNLVQFTRLDRDIMKNYDKLLLHYFRYLLHLARVSVFLAVHYTVTLILILILTFCRRNFQRHIFTENSVCWFKFHLSWLLKVQLTMFDGIKPSHEPMMAKVHLAIRRH